LSALSSPSRTTSNPTVMKSAAEKSKTLSPSYLGRELNQRMLASHLDTIRIKIYTRVVSS
jgi:hypothetical protein